MKKKVAVGFLSLLLGFGLFQIPLAQAGDFDRNERKGFFFSVGPNFGNEFNRFESSGGGGRLRIGGGFSEKFLLYYEGELFMTDTSRNFLWLFDTQIKGQYFITDDFYANLGMGLTVGFGLETFFGLLLPSGGYSVSVGLGNEFRLGKAFYIAPEATFKYYRMDDSVNLFVPGAMVHLGFYF